MTKQELEQINFLAKKSKTQEGLTPEELQTQATLRRKYIDEMKMSLRSQLENVDIKNEDGSITPLRKK